MSTSDIKPITISPELFNMKSKSVKNRTVKKHSHIKPNNLKSELMTKIKNYKHNKFVEPRSNLNSPDDTVASKILVKKNIVISPSLSNNIDDGDDDFSQSINFLRGLSCKNKNKSTIMNSSHNIKNETILSSEQPQYSCLKNSSLPTYREWKNKTLKRDSDQLDNVAIIENREQPIIQNITPPTTNMRNSNIPKKTTTLKYYLGKRGRKVAILIKNSETRKKINSEHTLLKQTGITDMKNYLKRHNLLKSGSRAPPEIIKKLYEQALLGGDIRNSNKSNIIHNYLAEIGRAHV